METAMDAFAAVVMTLVLAVIATWLILLGIVIYEAVKGR